MRASASPQEGVGPSCAALGMPRLTRGDGTVVGRSNGRCEARLRGFSRVSWLAAALPMPICGGACGRRLWRLASASEGVGADRGSCPTAGVKALAVAAFAAARLAAATAALTASVAASISCSRRTASALATLATSAALTDESGSIISGTSRPGRAPRAGVARDARAESGAREA